MDISQYVIDAFDTLTPNLNDIYCNTKDQSLDNWKIKQKALVTASGSGAMLIPGFHLVGLAADVAFLMNRMSVCSYGIGAIYGRKFFDYSTLEEEDFPNILALWSGDTTINSLVGTKAAADIATKLGIKVGGKIGAKIIGKTVAVSGSVLVGKKLGGKVGAKIAAKFAGKLIGKSAAGFLPFVGAAVGGGINLWFITGISDAAEEYYKFKYDVANRFG